MASSTRILLVIKIIYTLKGGKRFLLPLTYFLKNLVYPFTLQVTGKKRLLAYLKCAILVLPPTELTEKTLSSNLILNVVIPVTRRVKGNTRFVGKYTTGERKRFRPRKIYIFLIRITSRVDLAKSVCPSISPFG